MIEQAQIEQRVKEIVVAVYMSSPQDQPIRWQDLDSDFPLYSLDGSEESLGLDSLDALEIATELEEAFDLVLPTELDPAELHTVRNVTAIVQRLLREQHDSPA